MKKLFLSSLALLVFLGGCVLGAIAAVNYVKDMDKVKLTMQTEGNASDIFDAAVHANKS